jgi:hypothetical protein
MPVATASNASCPAATLAATVAVTGFLRSPLTELAGLTLLAGARELTLRLEAVAGRPAHMAVLDALPLDVVRRTEPRAHAALDRYSDVLSEHATARRRPCGHATPPVRRRTVPAPRSGAPCAGPSRLRPSLPRDAQPAAGHHRLHAVMPAVITPVGRLSGRVGRKPLWYASGVGFLVLSLRGTTTPSAVPAVMPG